jgi:hypothetical protein
MTIDFCGFLKFKAFAFVYPVAPDRLLAFNSASIREALFYLSIFCLFFQHANITSIILIAAPIYRYRK